MDVSELDEFAAIAGIAAPAGSLGNDAEAGDDPMGQQIVVVAAAPVPAAAEGLQEFLDIVQQQPAAAKRFERRSEDLAAHMRKQKADKRRAAELETEKNK